MNRWGSIYYQLPKQTTYFNQLDELNATVKEKRSALAARLGILFHQDNGKPHTAMMAQEKKI